MAAKKQINVRIAEPLLETVAEAARRRGETVTGVVEKAFEAYVQDAQPQSPPEPADPPAAPEKPAPRARAPRRATAKTPPEPIAAQDEGERITAEIESDPDEVARLRHSRQQAREGKAVRWDGPGEPGSLAAAHALAEAAGAPLKAASGLAPPVPETSPGTAVFTEPGGAPVVTYEVPPVQRACPHKINRGAYCKICRMEA